MRDAEQERIGSTPVAGVVSYRRAMRDAKEERTGNEPVAGAVSMRTDMMSHLTY